MASPGFKPVSLLTPEQMLNPILAAKVAAATFWAQRPRHWTNSPELFDDDEQHNQHDIHHRAEL